MNIGILKSRIESVLTGSGDVETRQAEADRVSLRTAVDALQEQQRVLSLRLRRNAVQSSLEDGPDGGHNSEEPSFVVASPAAAESDSDAVAATTAAAASAASAAPEPAAAAASSTAETSTSTTGGDERAQAVGDGAPDEQGPSMPTAAQEEEEEEALALKLPPSSMEGPMAPEAAFSRLARLLEGPATIGVEQMSIVESIHECVIFRLPSRLPSSHCPLCAIELEARQGTDACGAAEKVYIDHSRQYRRRLGGLFCVHATTRTELELL